MNAEANVKTERERILDKIKKCMALGKSSEPHEAAAALRQAQKLMEKHSISENEALGVEAVSVLLITPEPFKTKKWPLYMTMICSMIMKAFQVQAVSECQFVKGSPRFAVRYWGVKGRPELAVYAHEVIWRQLATSWKVHLRANPQLDGLRGARQGFWVGWLQQVRAQVIAFGGVPEDEKPTEQQKADTHNALIVLKQDNERTDKAMEAYYQGSVTKSKVNSMDLHGGAHAAGKKAGESFSLHRPVTGAGQLRIGHSN